MLGKLLKYDFKSMFRSFVPLWAALLAVSFINRFTIDWNAADGIFGVLAAMLYGGLIIAVIVVTIILIVQRFYNGLLRSEGYLMFTLPVKPWQLVLSKLIAALVVTICSIAAALLSVLFISADADFLPQLFRALGRAIPNLTGDATLFLVLLALVVLTGILAAVTHIYAALALGHLANSHRIGWAVGAYIVIDLVFMAAMMAGVPALDAMDGWMFTLSLRHGEVYMANLTMGIVIAWFLAQTVLCYVATERILSKRLNLE